MSAATSIPSPPPGKEKILGADASHAWVSAYTPEEGWIDLDPTNNLAPSLNHIAIAWGRDYGDVTPIRGVVLGGGEQTLEVKVSVISLDK
jgi:transglutaminase-like putative cysteine protease